MPSSQLIKKYNVAGPRYTSYPTVPFWDASTFDKDIWIQSIKKSFQESESNGMSLYIHLPYCESLCTYCGCHTRITVNHSVEKPYVETLLKEFDLYLQHSINKPLVKEIHLGGGTPTFFSAENLAFLLKDILSKIQLSSDASLSIEAHPNYTSKEQLETLFSLGFRRLSLGIQDFDPFVQDLINRIQTLAQVTQVVEEARSIGFKAINFDLVYGLPGQQLRSVEDTVNKVLELKPDRIAFYSYAHVPWLKPGQRKFTEADLPSDENKRALYELGHSLLTQAGYIEIGMDHFALPNDALSKSFLNNSMHRNFMGYTEQHTDFMLGLGASSISDTWEMFAQNIKPIEEYIKTVNKGELPVFRGHFLNKEDLIIRKKILDLMCQYNTNWEGLTFDDQIIIKNKLTELKKDGLVQWSDQHIIVTETGKPFVRNICMAFDLRLQRSVINQNMFSSTV
jgi:oxygen-independent coproporphyrinogen-3 oxidase